MQNLLNILTTELADNRNAGFSDEYITDQKLKALITLKKSIMSASSIKELEAIQRVVKYSMHQDV